MLTLSQLLDQAVRRHGDTTALVTDSEQISYRALNERAASLAAFLASAGIGHGACIALHLRNGVEYVVADLAILKLGAVKVPLNELMSPDELAYCIEHADATVVIAHASLPLASTFPSAITMQISVADGSAARAGWTAWPDAAADAGQLITSHAKPDDVALIMYTGGTTGLPKGVVHSQHGLALNILATVLCADIRADEVALLMTPLPHSAGFHLQACLVQGGTVILSQRFDPESFINLANAYSVTWTFAVPTMLYRILDRIAAGAEAPRTLRTILYGAAPMSAVRLEEGLRYFGPAFIQLFGQTECPNFITTLSKADHVKPELLTSCGRAVALVDMRIRLPGGTLGVEGQIGEVEVLSPYLLIGYHKDAPATSAAMQNGWLRTGDIGYRDESGYLFLVDRAKDIIISGGMNVYSAEVEVVLRRHPGVHDVAVIGVPDADWGESVVAFAIIDGSIDAAAVRAFAKTTLSAYKVPKRVLIVDNLPLTKYGKIDKKALRQSLLGACAFDTDSPESGMKSHSAANAQLLPERKCE